MALDEERDDQSRGRKSLPLNVHPGMIQGIPSAVTNQKRDEGSEQTVVGAAAQGFAGGFIAGAQQRHAEPTYPHTEDNRTAPVRNADGMTLADLTATAPGEEPLPGMSQPLIMDVLNEVQGTTPVRTAAGGAKRSARSAVMNPDHVAALKELDRGGDDLQMEGSHFGR